MPGWDLHTHLVPATIIAAGRSGDHDLAVQDDHLSVAGRARLPLRWLTDPAALLQWVQEQRLDGAVVSVPPALYRYDLRGDDARDWCDMVNTGLAEIARTGEGRLRVLGTVPLGDPQTVLPVAEEVTRNGAFSGLAMGTLTTSAGFADPVYEPLWTWLDDLGTFVLIHPGHCPDPRLSPYYLTNLLGNPYETALAAAELVFSGVLERHRRITFCLCHGGGALPAVAGRWQRGRETERPGVPSSGLTPRQAVRRFLVDDLVYDPAITRLLEETFGPDSVHVGSDWPFPLRAPLIDEQRAAARAADAERLTRPPNERLTGPRKAARR